MGGKSLGTVVLVLVLLAGMAAPRAAFAQEAPIADGGPAPAAAYATKAPAQPMDPRVQTTLTIVGAVALGALAVVTGPYILSVLEIGSVSVLCVVSPICY